MASGLANIWDIVTDGHPLGVCHVTSQQSPWDKVSKSHVTSQCHRVGRRPVTLPFDGLGRAKPVGDRLRFCKRARVFFWRDLRADIRELGGIKLMHLHATEACLLVYPPLQGGK